ncbi:dienelactone hydrolase family protein [Roseomonas sp. SSH11]|uniref:Dienelactone hydrolase family protein n=2 Tax=Pararoseomonas baculiformis TaxID=2820812 RepID=A0ABS4ABT8_9PROT|nr:dienelactone hydrolase family protein [Pararoseomonas baculiformis]
MRPLLASVLLAAALAFAAPPGQAQPLADLRDGRSGQLEFLSATPTGPSQMLAGTSPGTPITGVLAMPPRARGKVPAMIISHGSGGIRPGREMAWAERLNALGIATLVVDSFTPRGISATGADQSRLSLAASVADALSALRLLSTHPGIDASRIGIMGFSKGGQVALYTALEPFRRAVLPEGQRFALHVALYSSCSIPYKAEAVTGAPMLLLLGGADDYTPSAHCTRYAEWFRSKGSPVTMRVFEGAHHGFDVPEPPRFLSMVQSARDCGLDIGLESREGRIWHTGETIPGDAIPRYLRGCMQRGGTFGGDGRALAAAIREVEEAVRQNLLR